MPIHIVIVPFWMERNTFTSFARGDLVQELKNVLGMTDDQLGHMLGANAMNWFKLKPEDLPAR